ncbi:hypothetical protein Tco_0568861 [Tanacetum coccineum]
MPRVHLLTKEVQITTSDKGEVDEDVVNKRTNVVRSLRELEKLQSVEVAQKARHPEEKGSRKKMRKKKVEGQEKDWTGKGEERKEMKKVLNDRENQ